MPAHHLFLDLVVIVTAAAIIAVVGRSLRLALIPGYLIMGAIIGPHAAGLVRQPETAESVSGLAVVLLMFTIGLHMDVGGLRRRLGPVLAVGLVAAILVTLIGWPIGLLFGLSSPTAVAVSGALSISSTAAVLKTIQERRELHRPHGRLIFGALLVQDLLAVAMLGGVPLLAAWAGLERAESAPGVGELAVRMFLGIGGLAAMLIVGRLILPRLLAAAARTTSGEVLIVVSAAVALSAAAATTFLGFSAELGAFLAGFLLASTTFRFQIAGQLMPMRDLFMAVFFTTVGLELDPMAIASAWSAVIPGIVALLVIKTAVNGLTAWASGTPAPTSLMAGLALANAGEFSIVLLAAAGAAGVVGPDTEAVVIAIIVLSLILTPGLIARSPGMAAWLVGVGSPSWVRPANRAATESGDAPESPAEGQADGRPVVIAGYGVVGRVMADRFRAVGIPFTVIELNPSTVRKQAGLGRSIVYGDVSNRAVLESAGVGGARAVLLTIPDEDALFRACPLIREMAPDAIIAARTSYLSQAMVLRTLGADLVTIAEVATAEAMAEQVIERLEAEKDKAVGPA